MTFISLECEKLTKEYTSSDNPFGFKKDKRIEKWINLLSEMPILRDTNIDLFSGVHVNGNSNNSDEEAIDRDNIFKCVGKRIQATPQTLYTSHIYIVYIHVMYTIDSCN